MIDLTVDEELRGRAAQRARERGVLIPTFAQMRDPTLLPRDATADLTRVGLWDVDPRNLLRITWTVGVQRWTLIQAQAGFIAIEFFYVLF